MLHTGAEPRIKQRKLGRHGLKLLKLIHVIAMEVDAAWLDLSSGIEGISSWLAVRREETFLDVDLVYLRVWNC